MCVRVSSWKQPTRLQLCYSISPPESSVLSLSALSDRNFISLFCCSSLLLLVNNFNDCHRPKTVWPFSDALANNPFSASLPLPSPTTSPPQWIALSSCAALSPLSTLHQGRIWGLSAVERLLSQVDSQVAAAAFDGERRAGRVSDGSPAGRQAHRLALVKKAPPLCSHRRWM